MKVEALYQERFRLYPTGKEDVCWLQRCILTEMNSFQRDRDGPVSFEASRASCSQAYTGARNEGWKARGTLLCILSYFFYFSLHVFLISARILLAISDRNITQNSSSPKRNLLGKLGVCYSTNDFLKTFGL